MDLAANLGIANSTPLTDLRHCKIATLGVSSDLKLATVGTFGGRYISSGRYFTLVLATTLRLNGAGYSISNPPEETRGHVVREGWWKTPRRTP